MEYIQCEVIRLTDIKDNEGYNLEKTVGYIKVLSVPRVGEYVWFSEERDEYMEWCVTDVCHWVGNGEMDNVPYHKVSLYVTPKE